MIVLVASGYDARALRIAAHWGFQCAAILSAEDLCMPGWRLQLQSPPPTAVIDGKVISSEQIDGILTLRPCVFPEELQNIQRADRTYVAAELNAFLLAWLTAQSCPVLNRPTSVCLAGPNWYPEQWTHAAARVGIPAHAQRHVPNEDAAANAEEALEVIAVGKRCFGCDDAVLRDRTLKLADAADVELLSVRFSADRYRFLSASVWPSFADSAVLEAVRQRLEHG
jgi:hypothetical protein